MIGIASIALGVVAKLTTDWWFDARRLEDSWMEIPATIVLIGADAVLLFVSCAYIYSLLADLFCYGD